MVYGSLPPEVKQEQAALFNDPNRSSAAAVRFEDLMKLPSLKLTAKALENRPSQHERSLPTIDFHVRAVGFRECIVKSVLAVFLERFEWINLQKFSVRVNEALPKSWKLRMIWVPTRHLSYPGSQRVGICSVKERYSNTLTAWYLDICFGCSSFFKLA